MTVLLTERGRLFHSRFLGGPDRPARSGVARPNPAAAGAHQERLLGQHGHGGQYHSAARGLHAGAPQLRPPAAGGRGSGAAAAGSQVHDVTNYKYTFQISSVLEYF